MTDLYEMTMMQGYFKTQNREVVVFDAFYRTNPCEGGYAICAGLEQVIDDIKNLHFEESDIAYLASLNIFDDDFLDYLRTFHFSGQIPLDTGNSDSRTCAVKYPVHIRQIKRIMLTSP